MVTDAELLDALYRCTAVKFSNTRYSVGLCCHVADALKGGTLRHRDAEAYVYDTQEPDGFHARISVLEPTAQDCIAFGLGAYWVGPDAELDPFDPADFRATMLAMLIAVIESGEPSCAAEQ